MKIATATNHRQSDTWRTHTEFALIYETGAKPVFPSKSDKDKPKFTVKGHKETTGYPFNTFYQIIWFYQLG